MSTDPNLPDITDEPGSSVSIYVPDTQDAKKPQYTFLRLGKPDVDHETMLPPDPNVPTTAGAGGSTSPFSEGLLLYSTSPFNFNSPSVNTFSSDALNVVWDGSSTLYSANLQTNSSPLFFGRAANVTYQNVDQLTVSQGDSSNFLNGNSLTFWNGNDQSIGFGGLLWANMGFTSNIFGGEIINLTNTMATVQAPPKGDYEVNVGKEISAVNSVKLNVNDAGAGFVKMAQTLTGIVNGILLLGTAAAGVFSLTEIGLTDTTTINPDDLKKRMTQTNEHLEIMTTLVACVQAASVLLGVGLQIASKFAASSAVSKLNLGSAGALLEAGVAPAASTLVMTPNLAGLMAADVSISAGAAATLAEIQVAPNRITLYASPTTYINLDGFTNRITLAAGASSIQLAANGVITNGAQSQQNTPIAQFAPGAMPPQPVPGAFGVLSANVPLQVAPLRNL
jgi:hypothetical protein